MAQRHKDIHPQVIEAHNVRVNNLKGIDVTLPRDKFIVITGLSGSGKSSLAFDTLYAEGLRRYVKASVPMPVNSWAKCTNLRPTGSKGCLRP